MDGRVVVRLRVACDEALDAGLTEFVERRGQDRVHLLAVLVPASTLAPVMELLSAGGRACSREDAVRFALEAGS